MLPEQLVDEIGDALTQVFGRRINKGLAGDYEPVGPNEIVNDPSAMRFLVDCQNAVNDVLLKWVLPENDETAP